MELDQVLFGKITSWLSKRRNKPSAEILERQVLLEEVRDQCVLIGRAITGRPIDCIEAENIGGWKDSQFLLPKSVSFFTDPQKNRQFFFFRTVYMSELLLSYDEDQSNQKDSYTIEMDSPLNTRVIDQIKANYPSLFEYYEEAKDVLQTAEIDHVALTGRWIKPSQRLDELFKPDSGRVYDDEETEEEDKNFTEVKAKAVDEVKSIAVDREKQEEYMLTHNFEKVETLEEFHGNWRDFDGDDDLEEHAEALEQVKMNMTVRVNDTVHSVYQSDLRFHSDIPESADITSVSERKYLYPEWDYKTQTKKKDFCTLYEHKPMASNVEYVQNTLKENAMMRRRIKRDFNQFYNELKAIKKLEQGEKLNLDEYSDYRMGLSYSQTSDERIYDSKRKRKRDISFLFLLDLSMSADAYVNDTRVIDIEKQVALLLGEVLNEHHIDFQVDGFFSETRNHCSYIRLKGFNEKWESARGRIAAVTPQGYTRIGPAVRHATNYLLKTDSKNKWLVLLSDGKPNDYDRYEGTYGVKDIRQAIREAQLNDISMHTFAVEERAKFYLPQIFGPNNYNVLKNPAELISSISEFCQKVMRS